MEVLLAEGVEDVGGVEAGVVGELAGDDLEGLFATSVARINERVSDGDSETRSGTKPVKSEATMQFLFSSRIA